MGRLNLLGIPLVLASWAGLLVILGKESFARYSGLRLSSPLLTVISVLGLLAFGALAVPTVVIANLLGSIIVLVCTLALLRWQGWLGFSVDWKLARSVVGYGLRSHVGRYQLVDQLAWRSTADVDLSFGWTAWLVRRRLTLFGPVLSVVVLSVVAAQDRQSGLAATARTIRLTALFSVVLAIVLVPLMPVIVRLTFGTTFESTVILA